MQEYSDITAMLWLNCVHGIFLVHYPFTDQFLVSEGKMPFENIVGKGENAGNRFLVSEGEMPFENIVGKGENAGIQFLVSEGEMPFENIVGKRENAGNQRFLLFHNVFTSKIKFQLCSLIYLFICKSFHLDQSKILSFGKESNQASHCIIMDL